MKFIHRGQRAASRCLISVLIVLLSFSSIKSYAQKEAELVNKLRIALRDCARDIPEPPFVGKGTFHLADLKFNGALYYHKPNMRMELTFQGATFIQFNNDTIQWEYNPFDGQHKVKNQNPKEHQEKLKKDRVIDFASKELLNYKTLKNQLKYKGEQTVDSIYAYVLELTVKNSDLPPITFYINKRTSLIYKCESASDTRWYTNYKPFENFVYPMLQAFKDGETNIMMKYDSITIGKPIPDSLFVVPQEAFASTKEFDRKIERLLVEGDTLLNNAQYDAAIAKYNQVIKLDDKNYGAYNGRGLTKVYQKKYYDAITDLNMAIENNQSGFRAFNNRGLAKYYLGDTQGAMEDYNEAIRLDSTFVIAFKNRGFLEFEAKQYKESNADFSKAVALRPSDGDANFKYGVSLAQLGHYEEALESYRKAIELKYTTADIYNYRGVSEFKLEKYEEAATSFREAIKANNDNLQYVENLGNALYYGADYKNAQQEFERYLKKDPKNDEIHNMLGLCKYKDEDYNGAMKDFTKAIELNGESAVYFSNRASAKEEIEDYEGAISDYTESISRNPTDASNFYNRGLIKILTSKKLEGCVDLVTAKDMKYEAATEAIMKNCN